MTKDTNYTCMGINNAKALLMSNRFTIHRIDVLINSIAHIDNFMKNLMKGKSTHLYGKDEFYEKYPEGRSQGITVKFSGDLIMSNIPDFNKSDNICLLILDRISDPQNFGQIIRTAECAGVDGIIFPKHNNASITRTVLQVSQGAFVNMKFYQIKNLNRAIEHLKKNEFWITGFENTMNATKWYDVDLNGRTAIIVGSEGDGIKKSVLKSCDFLATIPMRGQTRSLNVSAAVSAILFERLRQIENRQ